jgi:LysM repeat protein
VSTRSSSGSATTESAPAEKSWKAPERSTGHTNRSSSRGDYTVRSGDTLSGIAERYGISWQRLYERNKAVVGGDPDVIVPGQRLDI